MLRGNGLRGFGKSRKQADGRESKAAVQAQGRGPLEQGASSADGEMGGHCTTRKANRKKASDGRHSGDSARLLGGDLAQAALKWPDRVF